MVNHMRKDKSINQEGLNALALIEKRTIDLRNIDKMIILYTMENLSKYKIKILKKARRNAIVVLAKLMKI